LFYSVINHGFEKYIVYLLIEDECDDEPDHEQ